MLDIWENAKIVQEDKWQHKYTWKEEFLIEVRNEARKIRKM